MSLRLHLEVLADESSRGGLQLQYRCSRRNPVTVDIGRGDPPTTPHGAHAFDVPEERIAANTAWRRWLVGRLLHRPEGKPEGEDWSIKELMNADMQEAQANGSLGEVILEVHQAAVSGTDPKRRARGEGSARVAATVDWPWELLAGELRHLHGTAHLHVVRVIDSKTPCRRLSRGPRVSVLHVNRHDASEPRYHDRAKLWEPVLKKFNAQSGLPGDIFNAPKGPRVAIFSAHGRITCGGEFEYRSGPDKWSKIAAFLTEARWWSSEGPDVLILDVCFAARGEENIAIAAVEQAGIPFVIAPGEAVAEDAWWPFIGTFIANLSPSEADSLPATERPEGHTITSAFRHAVAAHFADGSQIRARHIARLIAHDKSLLSTPPVLYRETDAFSAVRLPAPGGPTLIFRADARKQWQELVRNDEGTPRLVVLSAESGSGLTTLLAREAPIEDENTGARLWVAKAKTGATPPCAEEDNAVPWRVVLSPALDRKYVTDGEAAGLVGKHFALAVDVAPPGAIVDVLVDWGMRNPAAIAEQFKSLTGRKVAYHRIPGATPHQRRERLATYVAALSTPSDLSESGGHHGFVRRMFREWMHRCTAELSACDAPLTVLQAALSQCTPGRKVPEPSGEAFERLIVDYARSISLESAHWAMLVTAALHISPKSTSGGAPSSLFPEGRSEATLHHLCFANRILVCGWPGGKPPEAPIAGWAASPRPPYELRFAPPVLRTDWAELNLRVRARERAHAREAAGVRAPALPSIHSLQRGMLQFRPGLARHSPANEGGSREPNLRRLGAAWRIEVPERTDLRAQLSDVMAELRRHVVCGTHPALDALALHEGSDSVTCAVPEGRDDLALTAVVLYASARLGQDSAAIVVKTLTGAHCTPINALGSCGIGYADAAATVVEETREARRVCRTLLDVIPAIRPAEITARDQPVARVVITWAESAVAEAVIDRQLPFLLSNLCRATAPDNAASHTELSTMISVEATPGRYELLVNVTPQTGIDKELCATWAACVRWAGEERQMELAVTVEFLNRDVLRVADPQFSDRRWRFVAGGTVRNASEASAVVGREPMPAEFWRTIQPNLDVHPADLLRPDLARHEGWSSTPPTNLGREGADVLTAEYRAALVDYLRTMQFDGFWHSVLESSFTLWVAACTISALDVAVPAVYGAAVVSLVTSAAAAFGWWGVRQMGTLVVREYLPSVPWAFEPAHRPYVGVARERLHAGLSHGRTAEADGVADKGLPGRIGALAGWLALCGWMVNVAVAAVSLVFLGVPAPAFAAGVGAVAVAAACVTYTMRVRLQSADFSVLDTRVAARYSETDGAGRGDQYRLIYRFILICSLGAGALLATWHHGEAGRAQWTVCGLALATLGLMVWAHARAPIVDARRKAARQLQQLDPESRRRVAGAGPVKTVAEAWRSWSEPPRSGAVSELLRQAAVRASLLDEADRLVAAVQERDIYLSMGISDFEMGRLGVFVCDPWGDVQRMSGPGVAALPPNPVQVKDLYIEAEFASIAKRLLRHVPEHLWIELLVFGKPIRENIPPPAFRLFIRSLHVFSGSPLRGSIGLALPVDEPEPDFP